MMAYMTIDACMIRKNTWVLGRNRRELATGGPLGGVGSRRFDFDGYWSGAKWVKGTRQATTFDTEAEALKYLEAHASRIDA
jgi:hypothetical protein